MIANITRGSDMRSLVTYLLGPGRANEHSKAEIVGASPDLVVPAMPVEERALDPKHPNDRRVLQDVTRQLDGARQAHPDVAIRSGLATGRDDAHVWHCSLALPPGEHLSHEQWGEAVEHVLESCGLKDVSWIAVNHGPSKNEGEHVHVAATVLKNNGREAWIRGDQLKAGRACNELARRWGLRIVEGHEPGNDGARGVSPAEADLVDRRATAQREAGTDVVDVEPDRVTLQRQVRAAARSSDTEAEFVRRLRHNGVECIPRYETGTDSSVVGASFRRMAVTGSDGDERREFSGGRLAKDLTLPKMREWAGWQDVPRPDGDEIPKDFYRSWPTGPAWRGEQLPPLDERRETFVVDGNAWTTAQTNTARMPQVDPTSGADLAATAREASAATGALAGQVEGSSPAELARLSDQLARSAQTEIRAIDLAQRRQAMVGVATIAGQAALNFTHKPSKGKEVIAWALLAAQLAKTASTIAKLHEARGEHGRAQALVSAVNAVERRYPEVTAAKLGLTPSREETRVPADVLRAEEQRRQDQLDAARRLQEQRDRGGYSR